ncbi:hypothetical protein UXP70_05635 [Enterobacter cloacae]|uniref:hypothetical protein n=1 Tax=Enterobacter cloacae TaxID=550 RepID=UPI002FD1172C
MAEEKGFIREKADVIFYLFVFASVFVFFSFIHPTTIFTGDEWYNLSLGRKAWPEWHGFNPIKVVPEVSFPLLINAASFTLMPLGLTFLESVTFFTAALVAVMVVVYLRQFYLFSIEVMGCSLHSGIVVSIFHYLCLFGLFRTLNDSKSTFMLWEQNITCYYHYLLPALINGSVTLYFLRKGKELKSILMTSPVISGFIILSIYFAIFSNIFSSVILAVTCGSVILIELIKSRFKIVSTVKSYPLHVVVLVLWFISTVFEANGGRAERMGKSSLDIAGSIHNAADLLSQMSGVFIVVIAVGMIACAISCTSNIKSQTDRCKIVVISLLSLLIIFIALVMISAKASPGYIGKPVVMWGVLMYMIVLSSFGIASLLEHNSSVYLTPIVLLILVNACTSQNHSLKDPQNNGLTYKKANAVTQDMITQVENAVAENKREMILYVPFSKDADNWPIPVTRGREISWTLKSNGVIDRNISIKIQPDREKNKQFDISF